jgi:hypothetical protein
MFLCVTEIWAKKDSKSGTTAAEVKFMRQAAKYTCGDCKREHKTFVMNSK